MRSARLRATCLALLLCGGSCVPVGEFADEGPQREQPWVLPAEFEPVDELLLGWDPEFASYFQEVMEAVQGQARITFVLDPSQDSEVLVALIDEAEASAELGAVDIGILEAPVDSLWLRDFGPLVTKKGGQRRVADLRYWAEGSDDQLAGVLAADWLETQSTQVGLELEGGNLQVDGTGNCVVSTIVLAENRQLSEAQIRQLLHQTFGCQHLSLVPPLPGEPTGHVDMFMTFTGPGQLVVGRYAVGEDKRGREHLELITWYLQEEGYRVRRVPMPDQRDGKYRTFTNSLAVNGVVLVPSYGLGASRLTEAMEVFQDAYPGREIVAVDASALIELSGSVHCAAMTTPL